MHELKGRGVSLRATEQPVDTATAAGKAFLDMLGVFAEFERATLIERTNAGLAAARRRGTHLRRRFRLTPHQQGEARRMRAEEGKTYAQIAALFRVSRSVVWRAVNGPVRGGV